MKKFLLTLLILLFLSACSTTALIGEVELEQNSTLYNVKGRSMLPFNKGISWGPYWSKRNPSLSIDESESFVMGLKTLNREGYADLSLEGSNFQILHIEFNSKYKANSVEILGGELYDEDVNYRKLYITCDEESYILDLDLDIQTLYFNGQQINVEWQHKWTDDWSKTFYGWVFRSDDETMLAVDISLGGTIWVSKNCSIEMMDYLAGAVTGLLLYGSVDA